jgi:type III restriction enzyme
MQIKANAFTRANAGITMNGLMAVEFKFDANEQFQRDAIDSVVELLAGQEALEQDLTTGELEAEGMLFTELVFGNSLDLASETIRRNLRRVQDREVEVDGAAGTAILRASIGFRPTAAALPVEMESAPARPTCTSHDRGLHCNAVKFVIVVPSVAIRRDGQQSRPAPRHIRERVRRPPVRRAGLTNSRQSANHLIAPRSRRERCGHRYRGGRIFHPLDDLVATPRLRRLSPVLMDEPQSQGRAQSEIEELSPLFRVGYSSPTTGHVTA